MRSTALVAIAGGVLMMGSAAAAQEVMGRSEPAVRLRVVNRARLHPEVLARAEEDATTIYRAAGVQTTWLNGEPSASDSRLVALTVTLVSGEKTSIMVAAPKLDDLAMGFASLARKGVGGLPTLTRPSIVRSRAPPPAQAPPVINVGQEVMDTLTFHGDPRVFQLTAPSDGTLVACELGAKSRCP